ncbi:hypothetical protein HNR30_008984 [Nonomuraea soli]|uniref:DUF8083 domain-containing protein n=1 Tax=Nonomuraea soli TaxID=1032476 RepID=A0A7W0CUQ1_9ACTN|nr:hypothetical protein [Nonomuraea soli]
MPLVLPYAAYLRVYEPVTAFPPEEQKVWADYAESKTRPKRANALEAEHGESVLRLLARPPHPAPGQESRNAYLRRVEDRLYVCPWQTQLRSWLAFSRLRGSTPVKLMNHFVPKAIAEQTADDFDRFKRNAGSAGLRTCIRTTAWHIPLAWFVPFDGKERWLVLGTRGTDVTTTTGRNLIYVTSMAQARRRTARALQVLRKHVGEVGTSLEVEDVARWLEEFHPHSLVELDYGGLVHLMDDEALKADHSVAEIAAALNGLDSGQEELAFAMHQRVTLRWKSTQLLESAN